MFTIRPEGPVDGDWSTQTWDFSEPDGSVRFYKWVASHGVFLAAVETAGLFHQQLISRAQADGHRADDWVCGVLTVNATDVTYTVYSPPKDDLQQAVLERQIKRWLEAGAPSTQPRV